MSLKSPLMRPRISCEQCTLEQWKDSQLEVFFVGIPCCPEVFIERVFQAGHLRGFETHMEPVHEAIHANFCSDVYRLAKLRVDFIKTWIQKAKELQRDENSPTIAFRHTLGKS